MEKLDGVESLLKFLGDKKIFIPAFIIFVIGSPFFLAHDLLKQILPGILINYGEWLKFAAYYSAIILFVNLIALLYQFIKNHIKKYIYTNRIKSHLLNLSNREKEILENILNMTNNTLAHEDPATVSLYNKKIIYICSPHGHMGLQLGTPAIYMRYAITPEAQNIVNKLIFHR